MSNATFLEVENLFTDQLYSKTRDQTHLNICCDESDERDIIRMKDGIKQVKEFSKLSDKDVFIVLIYTYYALRLSEQTEEWLQFRNIKDYLWDKDLSKKLLFDISIGNIMLNGEDISSSIRKHILGLIPEEGGGGGGGAGGGGAMDLVGGKRKSIKRTFRRRNTKKTTIRRRKAKAKK
jgi:hypothetical protein